MKKGTYIRISELEAQLAREISRDSIEWDDLEWGVITATLAGEIFDEDIFIPEDVHAKIFRGAGAVGILEKCYDYAAQCVHKYRIKTNKIRPITNCLSINTKVKTRSLNYRQSLKRLKNALTPKNTLPKEWYNRINYTVDHYNKYGTLPKEKYKSEERERKN